MQEDIVTSIRINRELWQKFQTSVLYRKDAAGLRDVMEEIISNYLRSIR